MKSFPNPITAESFNEAEGFIASAIIKAKRKSLVRKISKPISSLLFTFLSFLLVFGLFFKLGSPEELIVFEKLKPITDIWKGFSEIFFTNETEWYIYWPILIVACFVAPLLISAIVKIVVSLCYKGKTAKIEGNTEAERAKALHGKAEELSKLSNSSNGSGIRTACIWLFVVAILAVLVIAFVTLKIGFSVGMIIGFVIMIVAVYFIFGLIFNVFNALNSLFYKSEKLPSLTEQTDSYWLSVDPDEKKRREEEAERIAREFEAARLAAEKKREVAAEKRIDALASERRGEYSLAKRMFKEAAEMGDALAMDNYARHCLINGNRSDAIYWLQKSIDTGEADSDSRALLRALKEGQHIDVHYN